MVLRGGDHTCCSRDSGRVSGALYRYRGRHERSSTVAAVQALEVVDAYGAGALGDCSSQWRGNVLRMVCGAIPVVSGPGDLSVLTLHPKHVRLPPGWPQTIGIGVN